MPRRRNRLGRKAEAFELAGYPIAGPLRFGVLARVGADASDPQQVRQITLEFVSMTLDVRLDGVHLTAASCNFQWAYNIMRSQPFHHCCRCRGSTEPVEGSRSAPPDFPTHCRLRLGRPKSV